MKTVPSDRIKTAEARIINSGKGKIMGLSEELVT